MAIAASGRAREYELEGTIYQSDMTRSGNPRQTLVSEFKVFVRDCGWLIETTELDETRQPAIHRQIGSTDGTEIFELVAGRPRRAGSTGTLQTNAATTTTRTPALNGNVRSNNAPVGFDRDSVIGHIWIMFASGCYFGQVPTNRIIPVYDFAASPLVLNNPLLKADWTLHSGLDSLPESVTYYRNPRRADGFVAIAANYTVLDWTNAGVLVVPSRFVFQEFYEPGPMGTNQPALRRKTDAAISSFQPICSRKELRPQIDREITVMDFRLEHTGLGMNGFAYRTGRWLTAREALDKYRDKYQERSKPPRWTILIVASLLLGPPIYFFVVQIFRRRNRSA